MAALFLVIAAALVCPRAVAGTEPGGTPKEPDASGPPATSVHAAGKARRHIGKPVLHGAQEIGFNSCREISGAERIKVNLKPDADLSELVAWISALTCKQFIVAASSSAASRKVTLVAPALVTRQEAYRVFLDALDSLGLTVEPAGKALKIIETAKAKSASIPVYGFDGRPLQELPRAARLRRQP